MAVMTSEVTRESASDVDLDSVLADGVRSVYQPIVDLDTGAVVGYEALARGPVGSSLESPGALFDEARAQGRVKELDGACWTAALRGAMQASLSPPMAVFVNVEPQVMGTGLDDAGRRVIKDARRRLNIFFEVTERALTDRPAQLLDFVARMRSAGFAIALDDVGADRRSLALLPLLRPDVVKLDMSLIHNHPNRRSGEVMNGVCAYAEQTGAVILAEGIETEAHLLAARSLGATLAQVLRTPRTTARDPPPSRRRCGDRPHRRATGVPQPGRARTRPPLAQDRAQGRAAQRHPRPGGQGAGTRRTRGRRRHVSAFPSLHAADTSPL
jgi:EAL domain-containing protein (putative c-di-GMP-specific phosphodiesterase class I)